jgi:hypothetical protein
VNARAPRAPVARLRRAPRIVALVAACLVSGRLTEVRAETPAPDHEASPANPWSFFGGFTWHGLSDPGLHLGAEYALASTPRFRSFASVSFQAYREAGVETGYAIRASWGQRFTSSFGLTFEDELGAGVQVTRYDTPVFDFQGSVAVASHDTVSRIGFSPDLVLGPGYDFQRLFGVPFQVYARSGFMLIYPDLNFAFQAALIAEFGVRWTPRR